MTGINIVTKLLGIVAVIVIGAISPCAPAISDKRLCFDPLCSEQISEAVTVLAYDSNDREVMSFPSNVNVKVFSKAAGKRQDLWGVEINGKRGYVPSKFIKEKRVYKRKLIHEVYTEDVVPNVPDDSPTNEAETEKNVPKAAAEAEDAAKKDVAESADKRNVINEEATVRSVPALDQVSPSYEVHDGTTIPLARNEEPTKPSYSTQIPQGIRNMEQQPIMSIHPSIESTLTLKTGQLPVDASVDDAGKYLEAAGLKDRQFGSRIAEEATTELPTKSLAQDASLPDVNHTSEANPVDPTTKLDATTDDKSVDAMVPADSSSSQANVENATGNDNAKLESDNSANNIPSDATNTELKSDVPAGLDNQILDEAGNNTSEQPLPSDKGQSVTMETSAVTAAMELTANNAKIEKNVANQDISTSAVDSNNNFSANTSEGVVNSFGASAGKTENSAVAEKADGTMSDEEDEESDEDEDEEDNEADEIKDLPEVDTKKVEVEGNLPVEQQQPAVEESIEAKPAEEPAPSNNLNIMSPLFNRLSKIPDLVKGIVEKTMSPDDSGEKATGDDKNANGAQPEAKESDASKVAEGSDAKSAAVDFSTETSHVNEYNNETDNSQSAAGDSGQVAANSEAQNSQKAPGVVENADANESEVKKLDADKVPENSKAPVDFSTNNNHEGQNETDNSKAAAGSSEQSTANTEAENSGEKFVNSNDSLEIERSNYTTADSVETMASQPLAQEQPVQPGIYKEDEISGSRQGNYAIDQTSSFNGFQGNRNLLNVGSGFQSDNRDYDGQQKNEESFNDAKFADKSSADTTNVFKIEKPQEIIHVNSGNEPTTELPSNEYVTPAVETPAADYSYTEQVAFTETPNACQFDGSCENPEINEENHNILHKEGEEEKLDDDVGVTDSFTIGRNYWETLTYLVVTALTTLLFSLGYYYIENTRRDGQLIAKINILEKELLVASKECMVLDDTLKSTKTKLDSIEDESFGSNEMVVSLKADLEASQAAKSELEDQVSMLEKELESATEAGLELERMLREILSTNNQDNPLAQSVEDLQTRLNAQQAANEALTNALNLKAQENETLTADLAAMTQKCEQLEVEVTRVTEELKHQNNVKSNLEQTLLDKVTQLEKQVKDISAERINLRKQLKGKEMELKDLLEVVNQMNINNLDFEKLYNVSRVKAEAGQLLEERNELQIRLSEVEGAHQLLEEHVKLINEEVSSLSEQCKLAEKAKRDAETRVEVLSNFFKEKEAQRQKEEAVWLEKQGEVSSTVERLHTMQNEIHNYKQQIEMLRREILDQEREYKNQIASLETKAHEHWVIARQNERRLEESKAEAGQLRNRLTLIEKNLNDGDPEAKLHRLETNGETATSPQLFIGAEASSSPIMFTGSSGVPYPPPPSYLYGPPPPPFLPPPSHASSGIPPYEFGQRPPPLGGRLSSPPPLPGSGSGRYDNPRSPPPPLSPSMLPPFGPPHRGFPPPFANDRVHPPPPPPPHSSILPPPLGPSAQSWGNETLPPLRNSGFRGHQQQQHQQQQQQHPRDQQRARNHKGSLHSSGESLDKNV